MEKKKRVKRWFEDHKKEIKTTICVLAGGFICYSICDKISDYKVGTNLSRFHDEGIIKFFDPSSNQEIDLDKAMEIIIKKIYN